MKVRITVATIVLAAVSLVAAPHKLTLDDIYHPKRKVQFTPQLQGGFVWIDDAHFFWPRVDASGKVIGELLVEAASGKELAFFDVDDLQAQVQKIEGVSEDDAKRIALPRSLNLHKKNNALLLSVKNELYVYSIPDKRLTRLTRAEGREEEASFSPDGTMVAFVRENDLYVVDAAGKSEKRLTSGGGKQLLNGKLDWVYQEEIYGRGNFKAYWWSPDSRSVAYLQLDETPVHEFTVVDHIPVRQEVEITDYPKAGDPNPLVKLFVADVPTGTSREISLAAYEKTGILVSAVTWTPDSRNVVYQVQDREQTWLDLNYGDRAAGTTRTIFRETTRAWVKPQGGPHYLKDGSFLWQSERDGWNHIYHYAPGGSRHTRVTKGAWEVRSIHGIDEKSGWIYFSGTARSHIGSDAFRVRIDGKNLERLTEAAGTHSVSFNPSFTMFIDQWSDVNTPPRVTLHQTSGKVIRTLDASPTDTLAKYDLARWEFLQVKTGDGFVMEAMMLKPRDFDPTKKYPVYQHTYAGPQAPQVRNAWGGTTALYHQLLAQHGIIVWIVDNRSASGKGAVSAWSAYKRLGPGELADLEEGIAYLKRQPWVDPSRIMLNGWSYGGFMTSYALTHSKSWKAGIAGGSVVDWRDYDSIYTERYMLTPQNNAKGYEETAPRNAAANLHGNLLLIHGTMDDNVHVQNTIQFAYELQKEGKRFELMLYPKSRHGVSDPQLVYHMRKTMFEFVMRELR